jgi:hypothetical protein
MAKLHQPWAALGPHLCQSHLSPRLYSIIIILKHTSVEDQQQQFYQYGGMTKMAPIPIGKRVAQQ